MKNLCCFTVLTKNANQEYMRRMSSYFILVKIKLDELYQSAITEIARQFVKQKAS